jgi:hypothetical protein
MTLKKDQRNNIVNLFVERRFFAENYTIGKLMVGEEYFCDTLEDKVRDYNEDGDLDEPEEGKVSGETAIPYGRYRMILKRSPKFKRDLPCILNVNDFTNILIHAGNGDNDTSGCILVGENKIKGHLMRSRYWETKLVELLKTYLIYGKELYINIV